MLLGLSIRDVVLIERLDLAFSRGLSVLTGETGAGKSILLDALGLATGARGDSALVRHGAPQASVAAEFELPSGHAALALLEEQGLAPDTHVISAPTRAGLVLRRILTADGRSRAFVNDQPVSVALLRQLGEALVEVHGQFDQHGLLNPATHGAVLDAHGGLLDQAAGVGAAWRGWRETAKAAAAAQETLRQAQAEEEFLRFAVGELTDLDPRPGEEAELAERRALLVHGEKLANALAAAGQELAGERGGVEAALRAALRHLERAAAAAGGRLEPVIAALDRAALETSEAIALLEKAASELDLDPRQAERVEERLFALRAMARKHRVAVDDLAALREEWAAKLASLEDGGQGLKRLRTAEAQAREDYLARSRALSEARREAARALDAAVARELPPLKLDKAHFATMIEDLPEAEWGEAGIDRIAFAVATNPGAPPGPLGKIASGGELSRFMLALKVVLARVSRVPTLIFDEVDSGIGGAVAAAVGERLARLAADLQVLVVTHSPQVAARGLHHWHVRKQEQSGRVLTEVHGLDHEERREEIARMLAGATITDAARAAASSLLAP